MDALGKLSILIRKPTIEILNILRDIEEKVRHIAAVGSFLCFTETQSTSSFGYMILIHVSYSLVNLLLYLSLFRRQKNTGSANIVLYVKPG